MNNIELIIAVSGAFASIIGFIITSGVMLKSNRQGFEMIDLKISSLIRVLALEREGLKSEISGLTVDIDGIKEQLKIDIYPRINQAEQKIKKNCQALIDFEKICNIRHK